MWRGSRRTRTPASKSVRSAKKTFSARASLPSSKTAHRRTKIFTLRAALILVAVTSLFGAVSWASFSDVIAVQRIVVEGNATVETRAIQAKMLLATADASLGLFSRQTTLAYPSTELENLLLFEFPKLKFVSIDPQVTQQQAVVSVIEREPYARWCKEISEERTCYHVDADGFIFETADPKTEDLILFQGGVEEGRINALRANVAPKYFVGVTQFLNELEALGLTVEEFAFDGEDARVTFESDWELRVALDKDLGAAAFNLEAVLDEYNLRPNIENLQYIDMRFDERVYYKISETTDSEE